MIRYSVQPRDRIFVNAVDFCLLLEIWEKRLGKNVISEYSLFTIFLILLKNLLQMHLKLLQKDSKSSRYSW